MNIINDDMDCLVEAVANKFFEQEPLARAILFNLIDKNILDYKEIMDSFDSKIRQLLQTMIDEEKRSGDNNI